MGELEPRPAKVFGVEFPHRFTTLLLSQFCGARTEPYTGFVSNVLCQDFKISIKGQRNMNNGFNNLPLYTTPDDKLTFGWGPENLIRSRAVHEAHYEHLATMIALSESFHETYAARVMFEMAQLEKGTEDITPHFRQWKNVIHSLNGAFATTDFGLVVEDFIRLDPFNVFLNLNDNLTKFPITAKSLAQAYLALKKITTGEEKQLTVIGSAIISWLAAVSDWLYDLRIAIFSTAGHQLHQSHPGQDTQVLFVFDETPGIRVSNKPWTQDHVQACEIQPGEAKYAAAIHSTPFSGRVVWNSLLPRVFGRSFHRLDHDESTAFAKMLGAAARTFQGLALGEGDRAHYSYLLSSQNKSNVSSYGIGLVQTLCTWLPELRRFQAKMERQLKLGIEEANASYVENIVHLRKLCHCDICKPADNDEETNAKSTSSEIKRIDTKDMSVPGVEAGYCLTTLTETIIALGLLLSRITVASALFPSRAGIQALYHSQAAKRVQAKGVHWTEHFALVYGNEWNAPDARRLSNTIQIFSGSRPKKYLPDNLVAISHEGICAYFVALEKVGGKRKTPGEGAEKGDGVKLIRIVSGGINIRHKVFSRAAWGEVEGEDLDDPWEHVDVTHLDTPLYFR